MNSVGLPIGNKFNEQEKHDYLVYQLVAMVIENCKSKWNIGGDKVYKKLNSCGIVEYLINGYDCLHTQSMEYIISDIEEILEDRQEAGTEDEV